MAPRNSADTSSTTKPSRKGFKRLKLEGSCETNSTAFHGLLGNKAQGSTTVLGGSTPTRSAPAPVVLTSTLGTVSQAAVDSTLSQQFFGVVPPLLTDAAKLAKPQQAQPAEVALNANENASTDDGGGTEDADANAEPTEKDTAVDPELATKEYHRKLEAEFPILAWLAWDDVYLRESIRYDGRGDALLLTACPFCRSPGRPEYSCEQCTGVTMCRNCIVYWHRFQPLHKIFINDSGFPRRVEAADLDLRIQLGHPPGEACRFRGFATVNNFTVLHTTGVHRITMDFCGCERGKDVPHVVQLLRRGFWPSTVENPQSATSFEALEDFTRLSNLGRLTGYDYHRAAAAKTDGAGLKDLPDVRQAFMVTIHEYRHIMLFKRAGRGHEPGGIAATPSGACVVRCPACPDKNMNLPPDWASRPNPWLYRAVFSLDANFRLSNRLSRSSIQSDPYLNDGKAYMPAVQDYEDHLKQMEGDDYEKPSDCSRFGAINQANMKDGRGLRTTGMAACTCRHEFWQANGLTTLRKGERYISVDYAFCGALKHSGAPSVLVTYDIACQWHKKLKTRLEKVPEEREIYAGAMAMVNFILDDKARFCVPKFHLYAHRLLCQVSFAIGWTVGAGALDGEGPERCWSGTNGAASSLREMGPGTMHDTMDDICGCWNWLKVCGMGVALGDRMWRAVWEGQVQCAIFTEFTDALKSEAADKVAEYERKAQLWEEKPGKHKNPYNIARKTATIKQIQLETVLAQGHATSKLAAQSGTDTPAGPAVAPTKSKAAGKLRAITHGATPADADKSSTTATSHAAKKGKKGAVKPAAATDASVATVNNNAHASAAPKAVAHSPRVDAAKKRGAPADDEGDYVLPVAVNVESDAEDDDATDDLQALNVLDADEATAQAKFLLMALKIESDRYRIETKRGEDGETITQATARTKTLNAFVRQIEQFREEQERVMPRLHATLTAEERKPDRDKAVDMKLWLPSDLPKDDENAPAALRALEIRLRWASMTDELDNLLHQLRLRGCLNRFKILNITGQRANTRARTAQDAVDANVKAAASAYRRHRTAYFNLVGAGDWENTMRTLVDKDCRGLGDRLIEQMEGMSVYAAREFVAARKGKASSGETTYELPWIWYRKGEDEDEDGLKITDELMLEWLKSRARARNWVEEVWLVDEEMGRVLRFNENMARRWEGRCYAVLLDGDEQAADTSDASTERADVAERVALDWDPAGAQFTAWASKLRSTIAAGAVELWDADKAWADGVRAYALKQAWIRREQAALWEQQFKAAREEGQEFRKHHGLDGICTAPLVMVPSKEDKQELKEKKRQANRATKAGRKPS